MGKVNKQIAGDDSIGNGDGGDHDVKCGFIPWNVEDEAAMKKAEAMETRRVHEGNVYAIHSPSPSSSPSSLIRVSIPILPISPSIPAQTSPFRPRAPPITTHLSSFINQAMTSRARDDTVRDQ